MEIYDHRKTERKWQKKWLEAGVYQPLDLAQAFGSEVFDRETQTESAQARRGKPDLKKAKRPRKASPSRRATPRDKRGKPFYNLMMFPYPSAEGLHVGNMYAFTGADVYGRFQRMQGKDVFQPIGLDGFGIHSENYAISIGKHPAEQAKVSEARFYEQLTQIGAGFAWDNRLETYDPDYYRWTQWIFVQMFKQGLAVRKQAMVNWCPSCKTVLADEQVEGGVCERCKSPTERKETEQWFFKITEYADRLLNNIEKIDWPEKIKIAQRNWIGRKEGIDITYPIKDSREAVKCFTTRPDTNFGATFIVLAPEYPLVASLLNSKFPFDCAQGRPFDKTQGKPFDCAQGRPFDCAQGKQIPNSKLKEIRDYVAKAMKKTEQQRKMEERAKTGVFTGLYAINELNGYQMPIWVSDFVLMEFGTGAVVGVPGHDKRDFEFAQAFDLPVVRVVVGPDGDRSPITKIEQVQEEEGVMVNSQFLNGMNTKAAIQAMMDHLEKKGWGKRNVSFHLRDWLISRQRYWGPPIPMLYCSNCKNKGRGEGKEMAGWYSVPEEELPVLLPEMKKEDVVPKGDGRSPLEKAPRSWLYSKCPECGGEARRETDVSDTFLDSSWYFLAYPNLGTSEWRGPSTAWNRTGSWRAQAFGSEVFDRETQTESAQARRDDSADLKSVSALSSQHGGGQGPFNREITKKWLPVNAYIGGAEHAVLHLLYSRFITMALHDLGYLEFSRKAGPRDEPFPFLYSHGLIIKDGAKMSKSRGNIVVPDKHIKKFGSDTLRTYLMFLGPYDKGGDFRDSGIAGMHRFLMRVWRMYKEVFPQRSGSSHPARSVRDDTADLNSVSAVSRIGSKTDSHLVGPLQRTIKKVTEDILRFRYNTAIAALMEFTNQWDHVKSSRDSRSARSRDDNVARRGGKLSWEDSGVFLRLLAPFVPHMTEELWQALIEKHSCEDKECILRRLQGRPFRKTSIHVMPWPKYNPSLVALSEVEVVVQVNGKLRGKLILDSREAEKKTVVVELAKKEAGVARHLEGKKIKQTIWVKSKLVNFVVS